ncbi:8-oxo-dGTP diphosphatase [Piscibacillus salipiscarius]|uniref:8-oxo-dGTP diphosphatase n=1 Tax=Piscibacillus salipiscarius TaxID=299480 RepID=A0ABW5Q7Y1_9BACI
MGKSEQVILTNMCMVYDDEQILVQDRVGKSWPGITFPGGHVEPGESFVDSVIREVYEETGLTIFNPEICGVKQFYTKNGERYMVLFYKTNQYKGELKASDEGEVFWIHKNELKDYQLANDFEIMYKVFDSNEISEFFYDQSGENWSVKLL